MLQNSFSKVKSLLARKNLLLLIKGAYSNWPSIWHSMFRERKIRELVLRHSNIRIENERGHKIGNVVGLARLIRSNWQVSWAGGERILLESTSPPVRMECRTNVGLDMGLMSSVFLNRVYGSSFQRKTVVDAGVYNGDSAIFFSINGARLVVGIEPLRENLELARRNIGLNNLGDRIKLVEAALSGSEGFVRFKCYPHLPNAGEINNSDDALGHTLEVKSVTVDSIMKNFGLPRIDLLKMNCEGAEYDIIESLSKQTASFIDEIRLEFHSGPEKLVPILEGLGYSVSGEKHSKEADGQLVAGRNQLEYNLASVT